MRYFSLKHAEYDWCRLNVCNIRPVLKQHCEGLLGLCPIHAVEAIVQTNNIVISTCMPVNPCKYDPDYVITLTNNKIHSSHSILSLGTNSWCSDIPNESHLP